jgi:hypothetical protein
MTTSTAPITVPAPARHRAPRPVWAFHVVVLTAVFLVQLAAYGWVAADQRINRYLIDAPRWVLVAIATAGGILAGLIATLIVAALTA